MAAYLIANVDVKDAAAFEEYRSIASKCRRRSPNTAAVTSCAAAASSASRGRGIRSGSSCSNSVDSADAAPRRCA